MATFITLTTMYSDKHDNTSGQKISIKAKTIESLSTDIHTNMYEGNTRLETPKKIEYTIIITKSGKKYTVEESREYILGEILLQKQLSKQQ